MTAATAETPHDPGYRLIDFGAGRKLESFAGRVLDRPSPAAQGHRKRHPGRWALADSLFDLENRRWTHRTVWPEATCVTVEGFQMPTFPSPFGHVGIFPEQARNWCWLKESPPSASRQAPDIPGSGGERNPPQGLNLFAYTGASTIAMALAGLKVAHVDAAKPNVTAARKAAELNGLADHPIRYLVDDAAKFVGREVRRKNQYHTIVLDPPAYGHGPSGKAWRLERDLWPLLTQCLSLVTREGFRMLVTGHSPQVGADDVVEYLGKESKRILGIKPPQTDDRVASGRLSLTDLAGRALDAGFFVRWTYQEAKA